jgi:hypothetical protein
MTAGEIKRLSITPQTTYHPATFKGAGNQGSQFCRIDIGTDFASSLPILGNRLHPIKPRTESLAGFRPQVWIAIVGIDGRIQQRAASRHQPGAPVPKVPHDLFCWTSFFLRCSGVVTNSPCAGAAQHKYAELFVQQWKTMPADGCAVCAHLSACKVASPKSGFL